MSPADVACVPLNALSCNRYVNTDGASEHKLSHVGERKCPAFLCYFFICVSVTFSPLFILSPRMDSGTVGNCCPVSVLYFGVSLRLFVIVGCVGFVLFATATRAGFAWYPFPVASMVCSAESYFLAFPPCFSRLEWLWMGQLNSQGHRASQWQGS